MANAADRKSKNLYDITFETPTDGMVPTFDAGLNRLVMRTPASGSGTYQPLDATLTAIAAKTITDFGLSIVDDADAATARTTLGLGSLATQSGTFSGTSSGTNSGDQTITLTGGVTGSGTGSFAATVITNANLTGDVTSSGNATTIAEAAVTLAKQANMATASLVYRKTTGSGAPEVNTLATLKTDLGLTGTNSGDQAIYETIGITIDGGGAVLTTGSFGFRTVDFAGTIISATMLADQSGSCVIDVKKSTYSGFPTTSSICASAKPTLSSAQKSQDTTLTGWTTSITSGDVLEFNVNSATTVTRVTLLLKVLRT